MFFFFFFLFFATEKWFITKAKECKERKETYSKVQRSNKNTIEVRKCKNVKMCIMTSRTHGATEET